MKEEDCGGLLYMYLYLRYFECGGGEGLTLIHPSIHLRQTLSNAGILEKTRQIMQSAKTVFVHLIAIWKNWCISHQSSQQQQLEREGKEDMNDSERYELHLMEIYSHELNLS